MTSLVAIIVLIVLLGGILLGYLGMRGRVIIGQIDPENTEEEAAGFGIVDLQANFNPARCLFLIGPEKNDPDCTDQRRAMKPLLQTMLDHDLSIVEIYGDRPPSQNGRAIEWLDTEILRQTMNAENGFHLVYVNDQGRASFHSIDPLCDQKIAVLLSLPHSLPLIEEEESLSQSEQAPERPDLEQILGIEPAVGEAAKAHETEMPDEADGWVPWQEEEESEPQEAVLAANDIEIASDADIDPEKDIHSAPAIFCPITVLDRQADDAVLMPQTSDCNIENIAPHGVAMNGDADRVEEARQPSGSKTRSGDKIFAPLAGENLQGLSKAEREEAERKAPGAIAKAVKRRLTPNQ
jgi:hypothetical protein